MSRRKSAGIVLAFIMLTAESAHAQKIYWSHFEPGIKKIKRANLDGSQVEELIDLGAQPAYGIALDRPGGKIYWSQDQGIRRANLDGSGIETVVLMASVDSIAIDEVNRRLYWSVGGDWNNHINWSDLDGQNIEMIVVVGDFSVESIQVHSSSGKVYYIVLQGFIYRANLDGSQHELLIPNAGENDTFGLAVDRRQGKLYWTDYQGDSIRRANLDGTGIESLPIPVLGPGEIGADACGQRILWNQQSGAVHRAGYDAVQSQIILPSGVADFVIAGLDNPLNDSACIPALSPLGVILLATLLTFAATMLIKRRRHGSVAVMIALFLIDPVSGRAQSELFSEEQSQSATLNIDSGWVSAGGSGTNPVVIFSHNLQVTGASWLRLGFSQVTLSGSRLTSNASFVRLTGTQSGAIQTLDAVECSQWGNSSAFFKGEKRGRESYLGLSVARSTARLVVDRSPKSPLVHSGMAGIVPPIARPVNQRLPTPFRPQPGGDP